MDNEISKRLEEILDELVEMKKNILNEDDEEREKENKRIHEERRQEIDKSARRIIKDSETALIVASEKEAVATGDVKDKFNIIGNLINSLRKNNDLAREVFDKLIDNIYEDEE